jgi:hypothetical protein
MAPLGTGYTVLFPLRWAYLVTSRYVCLAQSSNMDATQMRPSIQTMEHSPTDRETLVTLMLPSAILMREERVANVKTACIVPLFVLFACSPKSAPTKIVDIEGTEGRAAFYMYRPGGILDDYITLEVKRSGRRMTLVSVSSCSYAASKFSDNEIEITLFESSFSATPFVTESLNRPDDRFTTVNFTTFGRAATKIEMATLEQAGFTIVACKLK